MEWSGDVGCVCGGHKQQCQICWSEFCGCCSGWHFRTHGSSSAHNTLASSPYLAHSAVCTPWFDVCDLPVRVAVLFPRRSRHPTADAQVWQLGEQFWKVALGWLPQQLQQAHCLCGELLLFGVELS